MDKKTRRTPNLIESLIPIVFLLIALGIIIRVFQQDSLGGAAQVTLILGTAVAAFIAIVFCKIPWEELEEKIKENIKSLGSALIMLFFIGAIGSTWMLSGVVPTMIVCGIKILSPKIFLFAAVIICSIISLITGSSWTTIATFGVALIGIGNLFGIPSPIVAGAIISGAYFGDKLSPLSDTTIMASQTVGTPLFVHIRYMLKTTTPTIIITLVIFIVIGFTIDIKPADQSIEIVNQIANTFTISPWILIVPVATGILIALKVPTLITLFLASLIAIPFMIHMQPDIVNLITQNDSSVRGIYTGVVKSVYKGYEFNTGLAGLDNLASTSGMAGMMNTIWLILCASCFGGVMMGSEMLSTITNYVVKYLKSITATTTATAFSGIMCNLCTGDQYLSIILNANLYKDFYDKEGYEPRLLSRTVEDSTTVTSVLVPWNTCGMTQSSVLGVATLSYLPFCFFNYLSPIMSVIISTIAFKRGKIKKKRSFFDMKNYQCLIQETSEQK